MLQVIFLNRKKFLLFVCICCFAFSGCNKNNNEEVVQTSESSFICADEFQKIRLYEKTSTVNYDYIKGIWISQFDMSAVYCYRGKQRDKESYTSFVKTMLANIKKDKFNTIFLQLRPNGDSMYTSEVYPVSRYVSGAYGKGLSYDAVEIFIEEAHAMGLSVHGWINPLRLMKTDEIKEIDEKFLIKKWFLKNNGRVVEVKDRLYLNPAYKEVRQLIISGVSEIMERYAIDGIHMDDYFYPTKAESFDKKEFSGSGYKDLGDFRRNNINLLVKGLYEAVKGKDKSALYGIAPCGNIYSLKSGYYADAYLWCSQKGYIDYIMPQLYFGFLNKYCPFDKVLSDWAEAVTEPEVKLIIGLTAAKPVLAMSGEIDVFAGTDEGKKEWINNKDILYRSMLAINKEGECDGYCFFCYHYLYNVLTGEPNAKFIHERENLDIFFN